jgi:flagellar hook-length control protein FliK
MDISFYRENGGNKVTILVESELVKSELQKFIPVIQQGLQEKGVEPQTIQVDVQNSGDKQDNQTDNKSEKGNFQNRTGKEDYEENIAHTEGKRDYGYNTIEVIA